VCRSILLGDKKGFGIVFVRFRHTSGVSDYMKPLAWAGGAS
jgi:hypothetical protein